MKTPSNVDINIAIAKHCGWSHIVYDKYMGAFGEPPTHEIDEAPIPDYCNNLNAIHEAEMALTDAQYHRFTLILSEISWRKFPDQMGDCAYKNRLRCSFSGTAATRADAVYKIINSIEK